MARNSATKRLADRVVVNILEQAEPRHEFVPGDVVDLTRDEADRPVQATVKAGPNEYQMAALNVPGMGIGATVLMEFRGSVTSEAGSIVHVIDPAPGSDSSEALQLLSTPDLELIGGSFPSAIETPSTGDAGTIFSRVWLPVNQISEQHQRNVPVEYVAEVRKSSTGDTIRSALRTQREAMIAGKLTSSLAAGAGSGSFTVESVTFDSVTPELDFPRRWGIVEVDDEEILYEKYDPATNTFTVGNGERGYGTTSDASHSSGAVVKALTMTIAVKDLRPNQTYEARVAALTSNRRSTWSDWTAFTTDYDVTAPSWSGSVGLNVEAGAEQFVVSWKPADTDAGDLARYEVDVTDDVGSTWLSDSGAQLDAGSGARFLYRGKPGDIRGFRVRAVDTSGNASAWSAADYAVMPFIEDSGIEQATNRSFESGLTGWTVSKFLSLAGDTAAQDSTLNAVDGTYTVKVTVERSLDIDNHVYLYQEFPASPGESYRLTGWVYRPSTGPTPHHSYLQITYLDASDNVLRNDRSQYADDTGWNFLNHQSIKAPRQTAKARVSIWHVANTEVSAGAGVETVYFDQISCKQYAADDNTMVTQDAATGAAAIDGDLTVEGGLNFGAESGAGAGDVRTSGVAYFAGSGDNYFAGPVGVGTPSPAGAVHANGSLISEGFDGNPSSGALIDVFYNTGADQGQIRARDWGAATWKPLLLQGANITLHNGSTTVVYASGSGYVRLGDQTSGYIDIAYGSGVNGIRIHSNASGGWARGLHFDTDTGGKLFEFGVKGTIDSLDYGYIGTGWDDPLVQFFEDTQQVHIINNNGSVKFTNYGNIQIENDNHGSPWIINPRNDGRLGFVYGSTEYLYIGPAGDLVYQRNGLPSFLIEETSPNYGAALRLKDNYREWRLQVSYQVSNGYFVIRDQTAGVNRLTISTAGWIGIRQNSPSYAFDMYETRGTFAARVYNNDSAGDGIIIRLGAATPTSSNVYMAFQDSGGGADGTIVGDGAGGVNYNTASDARDKVDLQPITGVYAKIHQLRAVTYRGRGGNTRSAGAIAQDIRRLLPEVVGERETAAGPRLSLDYGRAGLTIAIAGLQEAKTEIEALNARITALEAAL